MSSNHGKTTADLKKTLAAEQPRSGRKYLKYLVVGSLLLLAVGYLIFKVTGGRQGAAIEYRTEEARRGDLTVIVTATGNLQPTNQVEVGTEVSGTIESVEVDYNDQVESGQVMAKLDTTMLEAQVKQSRAAVESARANLLQAEASVLEAENDLERLARVRELSGGRLPSQQDFDAAEAALKRARATGAMASASIAQAEARLQIDRTNLEKAIILSPINGVVLKRSVEPGQTVAASLQAPVLFTLAEDLTEMELHVDVDEADVGQVKDGQQATFTVDAYPDRTFPAHITQVRYGSQSTEGVVTYPAILSVDNPDLALRPGMTATADIVVRQVQDALLVPNAALRYEPPRQEPSERAGGSLLSRLFPRPALKRQQQRDAGGDRTTQQVWTLRAGKPAAVSVTTGASSGIMTEIVDGGVTAGMPLITESVGRDRSP